MKLEVNSPLPRTSIQFLWLRIGVTWSYFGLDMKREWASALGHEPTAGEPSSWAMLANQLANSNEVRSDVLTAMLVGKWIGKKWIEYHPDFESHIKNSVWTLAPESVMENFDAVALKLRSLADFLRPRFDLLDKTKVIVAKDLRGALCLSQRP